MARVRGPTLSEAEGELPFPIRMASVAPSRPLLKPTCCAKRGQDTPSAYREHCTRSAGPWPPSSATGCGLR